MKEKYILYLIPNKSGKLLKIGYLNYDNQVEINGVKKLFVSEMRIEDAVVKNSVTIMTYNNVTVTSISETEFNLATLI